MNFYLDFDDTLFDTHLLKQGLYEILEKNGLDKSYLTVLPEMKEKGQKLLNVRKLFSFLSESKNIPIDNFLKPLEELYSRCQELVFDDSIEFLEYLKSRNHKVYLLTYGDKEFQKEKVKASKLDVYFDNMIFTEELKYTLDINYKDGIFIDDSVRDLEGLYNQNAKKVFRIKRKNGKNSDKELNIKDILEFDSLRALQAYLEARNRRTRIKESDNITR